jgi:hypothetical protein
MEHADEAGSFPDQEEGPIMNAIRATQWFLTLLPVRVNEEARDQRVQSARLIGCG